MPLRVLGIGDNVADHYLHSNRIYPGGNALNFAAFARMLGAQSAYLGVFGDDFAGQHVYRTAASMEIGLDRCRILHGENGRPKVRLENGDRVFVSSNRGGVSRERPLTLDGQDLEYLSQFQLIHTSINSYLEHNLPAMAATGIPVSFDFSDAGSDFYFREHCPHITYSVLSCGAMPEEEILKLLERVHNYGSSYVLATRGGEGAVFSDGQTVYRQPAHLVQAVDTMGAGDSFLTAFLLRFEAWLQSGAVPADKGQVIRQALEEASRFAAQTCMVDGAFGYGAFYEETVK